MELVGREWLNSLSLRSSEVKKHVDSWVAEVEAAKWRSPHDVKQKYKRASIVGKRIVVFDIIGNNYRLVTKISYAHQKVLTVWSGTHEEYDRLDVKKRWGND